VPLDTSLPLVVSLLLDALVTGALLELTELAVQRVTFDERRYGDDDRDLDLLRFLHIISSSVFLMTLCSSFFSG